MLMTTIQDDGTILHVAKEEGLDDGFVFGSIDWANHGIKCLQIAEIYVEGWQTKLAHWIFEEMTLSGITLKEAFNRKVEQGFKGQYRTVHKWVSKLPEYQERQALKAANPTPDALRMRKKLEAKKNEEMNKGIISEVETEANKSQAVVEVQEVKVFEEVAAASGLWLEELVFGGLGVEENSPDDKSGFIKYGCNCSLTEDIQLTEFKDALGVSCCLYQLKPSFEPVLILRYLDDVNGNPKLKTQPTVFFDAYAFEYSPKRVLEVLKVEQERVDERWFCSIIQTLKSSDSDVKRLLKRLGESKAAGDGDQD
jgi:translation initiation factor 1 (eIF-1/SUI1)